MTAAGASPKKAAPTTVDADRLFAAFNDGTRRRILNLLSEGETCVGDLVTVLELSQPAVSRHLAYLRRAGLVRCRRSATWAFYSLQAPEDDVHGGLLATVASAVPEGPDDLERARALRAAGGCCPQQNQE